MEEEKEKEEIWATIEEKEEIEEKEDEIWATIEIIFGGLAEILPKKLLNCYSQTKCLNYDGKVLKRS